MTGARRRLTGPATAAVAALIAALVDGCQPLPHPFADDRPPAALIAVPDSFNVTVGAFEGEPRATADKLRRVVAKELLKHNIPASDETSSKTSYKLDGRIEERPDRAGKSFVTVFWRLRDPRGAIVSERSDRLAAPTHDWAVGGDGPVTQLASAGAGGVAALLTDQTPKEAPGGGRVRVAIRQIEGASGDGNNSLALSLAAVLKHQDIDLVDAASGKPDLMVDCQVKLGPAPSGQQHVAIVWRVSRVGGGEIGQVAQENDVPRGRLDGAWGDVAYSVAMAAEGGIMQLVDRGTPPQRHIPDAAAAASDIPPPPDASAIPTAAPPAGPPVAGNIASPEVNLPPVDVAPQPNRGTVPGLLPLSRGVPLPQLP
ncbi:MAG TPA: hypothetical protein VMI30_13875 [Stellaceae bacterium]|nr:hypothetical protein [Stellaceae bacterium]